MPRSLTLACLGVAAAAAAADAGATAETVTGRYGLPDRYGLRMRSWPTTAYNAGDGVETTTVVPAVSFVGAGWAGPFSSARLEGTITAPATALVTFSVVAEAGASVRLWVDDHMHVDSFLQAGDAARQLSQRPRGAPGPAANTTLTAAYPAPLQAGRPYPLRLEYAHASGADVDPVLVLSWEAAAESSDATTNAPPPFLPGVVPSSALAPVVRPADDARWALRKRMVGSPASAWQTSWIGSATAHVHSRSGLALSVGLADVVDGSSLDTTHVFSHNDPARVRLGPHAWAGSVYTQLNVSTWGGRACDVCVESTVMRPSAALRRGAAAADAEDADEGDLALLITASGPDCGRLAVVLQPVMLWERVGAASLTDDGVIQVSRPGFDANVSVYAGGPTVPFLLAGDVYLAQPLLAAALPAAAAAGSGGVAVVSFTTGRNASTAEVAAAVVVAAAAQAAALDAYPPAQRELVDGLSSIIAWNTIFTVSDGHFAPVSRGWNWGPEMSLKFDWDLFFLAAMAAQLHTAGGGGGNVTATTAASRGGITPRDVAYTTFATVALSRTWSGLVPNWWTGMTGSADHSEPQIGAYVLRELVAAAGNDTDGAAAALMGLTWEPLVAWHNWTWARRRAEGVLAAGSADGLSHLMCLGSDTPSLPPSAGEPGTLNAARLESGQDNGPEFSGVDCIDTCGPITFNASTGHMTLYSVMQTALFLSDTEALLDLAPAAGAGHLIPLLRARFDAVAGALNAHLWDGEARIYTNRLFNGSFYRRYSPTSFYPLLAGVAPDDRVAAMVDGYLTSPDHFCVTDSHRGPAGSTSLVHYTSRFGANASLLCGTPACIDDAINNGTWYYVRLEAKPWAATAAPEVAGQNDTVLLRQWRHAARGAYALTADATPPGDGFELVRVEAACAAAPSATAAVPLQLWLGPTGSSGVPDHLVCGTSACAAAAAGAGYTLERTLCYAGNATGPANAPCPYGVPPSISRSDPDFGDGAGRYWRGRLWGPHAALVYWGLRRYAPRVPSAAAAARVLASEAGALFLRDWRAYRHVNENANPLTGTGGDCDLADPAYHWGGLWGLLPLLQPQADAELLPRGE